jgi:hypothetical protein
MKRYSGTVLHSTLLVLTLAATPAESAISNWALHRCDLTSPGISFPDMANARMACCMYGWFENAPGSKLDCMQTPTYATFDELYNAVPDPNNPGIDGLARPNRVFVVDSITGTPIPGFYDPANGLRCNYRNTTGTPIKMQISRQYELFDQAITTGKLPTEVPQNCTRLIRVALETICPPNPSTSVPMWRETDTEGNVRCSAAKTIKLHIGVNDLVCDS